MGYVELSYDLRMNPSDANVKVAKTWLSKQKKSTQSIYSVLTTLIEARPDAETLEWFENWLQGRDIDLHLLFFSYTEAAHDWLINFLRKHNDDPGLGKLWHQLIFDLTLAPENHSIYPTLRMSDAQLLIDGASDWLIAHGNGEDDSIFIARCLTELTNRSDVQEKSLEVLRQCNDSLLASYIIEQTGSDDAIEIGYQIMNSVAHHHAVSTAAALMKTDPQKHWSKVESFLRRHWDDTASFPYTLGKLMSRAPQVVAPLAFEWIDDHPKSREISRIITLNQTQQCVDVIWAGLQTRTTAAFAPEILEILLVHYRALSIPKEATDFGDAWTYTNQKHKRFFDILCGLLRADATDGRLKLARDFLDKLPEEDRGMSLVMLRRRAPKHFNLEALDWAKKHPHIGQSALIIREHKHRPDSPDDEF
ncbi:MAG: hypothetical protein HYX67_03665 [Candidatus Melainabacteria bacterium]|nr:hypothetical protein [Candidatus Melainabacteria bacterium]